MASIHCRSEEQARLVLRNSGSGCGECGLELHPEKTRIVYCQDINRTAEYPVTQFTFLGYTFRPRRAVDKYGRVYVNFSPAVSREALTAMRQTVRGWHLQLKCDKELGDLSNMFDPVLRGWANYYGRFYPSALKPLWRHVNAYLVRWLQRKYKHLARGKCARSGRLDGSPPANRRCVRALGTREYAPRLDDGSRMSSRGSRPVLRGAGAAMPRPTHPYCSTGEGWLYLACVMDLASRTNRGLVDE